MEYFGCTSGNFAYRFDDEGRIIDNITNQAIGICTQKKKEILADYDAVNDENDALKARLSEIEAALEEHRALLPDALLKFIQKPPSVESLQSEIAGLKSELKEVSELKNMLAVLLSERGAVNGVDSGAVPPVGAKSANPKGRGGKAGVDGDKPE